MRLRLITCLAAAGFMTTLHAGHAQECSPWMNDMLIGALRPVMERTNPCASLREEVDLGFTTVTLALDRKHYFVLSALSVCPAPERVTAKATFDIACTTAPDAPVQLSVAETVDVETTVRTADCAIERFDIRPRSEAGRVLLEASGLTGEMRETIAPYAKGLCGG